MEAFETLFTDQTIVACDGGAGGLGHPRVFLHLDHESGDVTCPYCSRRYMQKSARLQGTH